MITTIVIKKSTKERLSKLGTLSGTYDSVINDILDYLEKCEHNKKLGGKRNDCL